MHGAVLLRSKFFTAEQVEAITTDHRSARAGLEPRDVVMLDFVEKMALNAYKVTLEDVDALRQHGFAEDEIVDIVLATSARALMSKTLDALGARADAEYESDPVLNRIASFER